MIAIDTGVLVRIFVDDGRDHNADAVAAARRLLRKEKLFVPVTVLLETEWALRSFYRFPRADMVDAFGKLLGLETVEVEDAQSVEAALEWFAAGMDFADALHLARSQRASRFVTFDRDFIRRSRKLAAISVSLP